MTLEEMKKVAAICSTADDGCDFCVKELMEKLKADFPQFVFSYTYDGIIVGEKS